MNFCLLIFAFSFFCQIIFAGNCYADIQICLDSVAISNQEVDKIYKASRKFNRQFERRNLKFLRRQEKIELKIQKKLCLLNPDLSDYLFNYDYYNSSCFKKLHASIPISPYDTKPTSEYFPAFDSLKTIILYLDTITADNDTKRAGKILKARNELEIAENNIRQYHSIRAFQLNRKEVLKHALAQHQTLRRKLLQYEKSTFYQNASLQEIKKDFVTSNYLKSADVFSVISAPHYAELFKMNSAASKFYKHPNVNTSIKNFQTVESVKKSMNNAIDNLNEEQINELTNEMKNLKKSVTDAKKNISHASNFAGLPDFKVNPLKSLPFKKRFFKSVLVQPSLYQYNLIPIGLDFGLKAGYKFLPKCDAGIGAVYKPFFNSLQHSKLRYKNYGVMSFVNYSIKNNMDLYAGYEKNFFYENNPGDGLKKNSTFKDSFLAGVDIKINSQSKRKKYGTQILYDFLADQKYPITSKLIIRSEFYF